MLNKIKNINYKHYICIILTLTFISLSFFFTRSYIRIWESIKDFGTSFYYYIIELFYLPNKIEPTIISIGNYDFANPINLFASFDYFKKYFIIGFKATFNVETILNYLVFVLTLIISILKITLILIPFIIIFIILFNQYFKENENKNNEDSKQLKVFKLFELKIYRPIENWIKQFIDFIKDNKVYKIIWLIIAMLYFNIITIIIEFISFYLYFVVSFDFIGIFKQIYKLILDLLPLFKIIPLPIRIILALIIFNIIRKNIAYSWLYHFENRNKGYINSTGQVSMICSPMGKGKTTTLTDMALSQEIMFRNKAFEKILENDLMFPNFPFINLETELNRAIKYHQVYNLATCKLWIRKKHNRNYYFGYDYQKYGLVYYNGLHEIHLFDMLENYVQLYFVYVIESSLLVSNYGIREDNVLQSVGYFPMWHSEFFKTNNEYIKAYSRHAHILDMDMLRLGKKVIKDNIKSNALEFGVIVITEGGKERGNMLDNKEIKKNVDEANQKNDMFNKWLKMCRHSATIDNFPFIKVFIDEQRPESMGADVRELCEKIIFIEDKSELKTSLMLFRLETMIYDFLTNHFTTTYYNYRFVRGDNTLFMYLFKNIYARYNHYYNKMINTFGYYVSALQSEKGTLDNNFTTNKYYLMRKKIYSKRFATDCFSDFFSNKSLNSPIGLNDLEEFSTERATIEELQSENSYFINDLMKNKE